MKGCDEQVLTDGNSRRVVVEQSVVEEPANVARLGRLERVEVVD